MTADELMNFEANHIVLATGASWRRDGLASITANRLTAERYSDAG